MKSLYTLTPEHMADMKISDWAYTTSLKAETFSKFKSWVSRGLNGPLSYLEGERLEKRENLNLLRPEAKSVLVFLFDYTATKKELELKHENQKIAAYTLGFDGEDYHFWIKRKLIEIGDELKSTIENLDYDITLDVHPVLERDLAHRSGLGWFGKNSMLISKAHGSYTLIGSLVLNQRLDLELREVELDHCGSCKRCIEACPTDAIVEGELTINASKCISTHTIEVFKDESPPVGFPAKSEEIFGCDICQEVCPWNIKPLERSAGEEVDDKLFNFFNREINKIHEDIESMSNNQFKIFFAGTSFSRSGKRGLLKNLRPYL